MCRALCEDENGHVEADDACDEGVFDRWTGFDFGTVISSPEIKQSFKGFMLRG